MRAFLILFTAIFSLNVCAQSPSQTSPKAKSAKEKTETDMRGTEQLPIFVKVKPPEIDEKEGEEKAKTDWWSKTDWFLVSVGILQLIVFAWQAMCLRQTVKTMKDTANRQLRAYVGVEKLSISPDKEKPGQNKIDTTIINTGQTPAYDVKHWQRFKVIPFPPSELTFPLEKPEHLSKGMIGPGHKTYKHEKILADTNYYQSGIMDGTMVMYVWGKIEYRDAFNVIQHTRYRFMRGGNIPIHGDAFAYCDDGNEAT